MRLAGYEQKPVKKTLLSSLTKLPMPKLGGAFSPSALMPSFLKRSA
jgi:hypothetical protein